jgi:hypothetical protein
VIVVALNYANQQTQGQRLTFLTARLVGRCPRSPTPANVGIGCVSFLRFLPSDEDYTGPTLAEALDNFAGTVPTT